VNAYIFSKGKALVDQKVAQYSVPDDHRDNAPDPWESTKDRRLGLCAFSSIVLNFGSFPFPSPFLPYRW